MFIYDTSSRSMLIRRKAQSRSTLLASIVVQNRPHVVNLWSRASHGPAGILSRGDSEGSGSRLSPAHNLKEG